MPHIRHITRHSDRPQAAQLLDLFRCLNVGAVGVDRFEQCDNDDPDSTKKSAVAGAILQIFAGDTQS